MAKESMKAREVKRAKMVAKYAEKRAKYLSEGNYEALQTSPHHNQAYKVVGTITEVRQRSPYIIARIQTTKGDIMFCYISGKATIEVGDGKTYELYADPYGTDAETGLPYMHAWFILKKAG